MASISIKALVVGEERLCDRGLMTEKEFKARRAHLEQHAHALRDLLIVVMGLVGFNTAAIAWDEGLGPAAWAFAICCMCPAAYRKVFGQDEASPAASSLVWSKRDDGSVALVGVPFYCDGTRGEAPQDAEEWISEAVCVCAVLGVEIGIAVWVLGVARARNAIIVACCLPKLLLKLNRYM